MEKTSAMPGEVWRLPDGQHVTIDSLYRSPLQAVVRRIEGPRGTRAVCRVSQLQPAEKPAEKLDSNSDW